MLFPTAQHTEDRDLAVEVVIAQGETGPGPHDGGLGHVIVAHGQVTGDHVTGGPDLGQEDVHALQEEDQGIGNCRVFCALRLFGYSHLTTLCQPCFWGRFLFQTFLEL